MFRTRTAWGNNSARTVGNYYPSSSELLAEVKQRLLRHALAGLAIAALICAGAVSWMIYTQSWLVYCFLGLTVPPALHLLGRTFVVPLLLRHLTKDMRESAQAYGDPRMFVEEALKSKPAQECEHVFKLGLVFWGLVPMLSLLLFCLAGIVVGILIMNSQPAIELDLFTIFGGLVPSSLIIRVYYLLQDAVRNRREEFNELVREQSTA